MVSPSTIPILKPLSRFVESGKNGKDEIEVWSPRDNSACAVRIYKYGKSCASWTSKTIGISCRSFDPIDHVGVVGADECYFR